MTPNARIKIKDHRENLMTYPTRDWILRLRTDSCHAEDFNGIWNNKLVDHACSREQTHHHIYLIHVKLRFQYSKPIRFRKTRRPQLLKNRLNTFQKCLKQLHYPFKLNKRKATRIWGRRSTAGDSNQTEKHLKMKPVGTHNNWKLKIPKQGSTQWSKIDCRAAENEAKLKIP